MRLEGTSGAHVSATCYAGLVFLGLHAKTGSVAASSVVLIFPCALRRVKAELQRSKLL